MRAFNDPWWFQSFLRFWERQKRLSDPAKVIETVFQPFLRFNSPLIP